MSNTPRTQSAFIVLGVGNKPNTPNYRVGIIDQIDDNDIQRYLKLWCDPVPQVLYYDINYQGKTFGVIEIFPDRARGPYYIKSNLLQAQTTTLQSQANGLFLASNNLYFRRGTTNDVARPADIDYIKAWFQSKDDDYWQSWDMFKQACHYFAPQRHYILISNSLSSFESDSIKGLTCIDWTAIIDFDLESAKQGLLNIFSQGTPKRNIVRVIKGDKPAINPKNGLYWLFARGLQGRQHTIVTPSDDWKRWKSAYGSELETQLTRLAGAIAPELVTFIVLWYDYNLLRFLQTTIDSTAGFSNADYVIVTTEQERVHGVIASEFSSKFINIACNQLCSGLLAEYSSRESEFSETHNLPLASGASIQIPHDKDLWLNEELEIVHLGLASNIEPSGVPQEFLRGALISWSELNLRKDAERDKTSKIDRRVRQDLSRRETVRIQIYHRPGAGGTTVARRILWDLHTFYPCAVLMRSDPDHIDETAERLAFIYGITQQPVLLLVDSAQIAERLVDDLFNLVRSRGYPVVMLLTSRRFLAQDEGPRAIQLELNLTNSELPRFLENYKSQVPDRTKSLNEIVSSNDAFKKTAFNFGLTAYGKDFYGIDNFVKSRLSPLTEQQKKIVIFLALAHYYAQQGINTQAFSEILAMPPNKEVRFENVFEQTPIALDILIQEAGSWRPIHYLISETILRYSLSPTTEGLANWRQHLSLWSRRFIEFCRGSQSVISRELLELVRRVFVYRDNLDLLGQETHAGISTFSRLIQDIPSPEGRQEVFKHLTDNYPEEAHFWAHYGRFLSSVMKNYGEALLANQTAIELQPDDHVLWHVQGMIFRYQAVNEIENSSELVKVVTLAEKASECFAQSRLINPDNEHGYIGEAQLLIRILNYAGKQTNGNVLQYMRQANVPSYIRNAFDQTESLLAQIRTNREGEGSSSYERQCRASLHELYGDPQQALQIWENLLTRDDINRPSIRRQIVYTLLDRDKSWTRIRANGYDRVITLLQENLEEEPNNERDLRLWLQAVRYAKTPPSIESLIERITYWKANTNSLDATYYLYVFYTLRALEGLALERAHAERFIEECKQMSRYRRNRLKSFEWYGQEDGVKRIVHQSVLGDWQTSDDFWEHQYLLQRLDGIVARVDGPEAGYIEVGGLRAFFVPGKELRVTSNDINRRVNFFLGFSYSGLRAWDVQLV